jgi:pimeloyl-ACP methyl ester carboxylesterase
MSSSHFVKANGIRQHVLEYPGDGPPIFLLHGLTANAYSFGGLVAGGLAPALHVYALDLRGRGLSDKPDSGYSIANHAADVLGVLDALGIEQAVIGGHSFGGLVTYHLAAHHPDRVSKVIVLDSPPIVSDKMLEQIKPALARLGVKMPSADGYIEKVKNMPYYENDWDEQLEAFYRADLQENADGTVESRSSSDHIWQAAEGVMGVDWGATAAQVTQPVLFLRATDSYGPPGSPPIVTEELAQRTMQQLQNGRLLDIPGNHVTYLFGESATQAARAIVDFVRAG